MWTWSLAEAASRSSLKKVTKCGSIIEEGSVLELDLAGDQMTVEQMEQVFRAVRDGKDVSIRNASGVGFHMHDLAHSCPCEDYR